MEDPDDLYTPREPAGTTLENDAYRLRAARVRAGNNLYEVEQQLLQRYWREQAERNRLEWQLKDVSRQLDMVQAERNSLVWQLNDVLRQLDMVQPTIQPTPESIKCKICTTEACEVVTRCGHLFCATCLESWFMSEEDSGWSARCPICRKGILREDSRRFYI